MWNKDKNKLSCCETVNIESADVKVESGKF